MKYIVDKIKSQWTKGNITHGIFLDVKAAFDKVWHRGLLAKLDQIKSNYDQNEQQAKLDTQP